MGLKISNSIKPFMSSLTTEQSALLDSNSRHAWIHSKHRQLIAFIGKSKPAAIHRWTAPTQPNIADHLSTKTINPRPHSRCQTGLSMKKELEDGTICETRRDNLGPPGWTCSRNWTSPPLFKNGCVQTLSMRMQTKNDLTIEKPNARSQQSERNQHHAHLSTLLDR